MSFDFAVTDTSSDVSTSVSDEENEVEAVDPDFEPNETGDLYLTAVDWEELQYRMLQQIDLEKLKIYGDDTLEDVGRLLGEHEDAHPQQKLHMVAALFKSTAGKKQRDNDHAIGLQNSKAPEEHFEDSASYALYCIDLPSITWDDLDGGEREALEEMGVEVENVGFDSTYGGVKLPEVNGERVPIAVEDGSEVMDSLEVLQGIPDDPSKWTEDGFEESSDPSVFGDAEASDDSEKVADESSDDNDEVNLAENPEAVVNVNVGDIRSEVTDITSLRTVETMLRAEQEADNTRSSAVTRLEERRNALRNSSDEVEEEADDGDEGSVESLSDLSDADKSLVSALLNSGEAESREEAIEIVQG